MNSPLLRQSWSMSAVLINMFGQGLVLSYPASLLPALNQPDSPIKVDLHSSSWLGSIVGVAGIPGFLISSVLMAVYGRRIAHGILILPGILGWLMIYFGGNISALMIGRFLGGLSATSTVSLGAIVIGEYTCPKYRGVFLCLKNATVCIGAMVMHIMSQHLHWRTIALTSLAPFVVAAVIICTWPESPAWLASKHQYEKSEQAFFWLRGYSEFSRREIEGLLKAQNALSKLKIKTNYCDKILNFVRKFSKKDFLMPSSIIMLATTILELSGRHIFPAYALQIMSAITGENSQAFHYALAIDIIITVSAIFASVLVKKINRRTLLFSTGSAALVVLMAVCLYLFLASKNIISNDRYWAPVSLLVLYFVLANLGCAPIPLALVGEVFPFAHRGVGSALSGIWISICLLAGLQSTPHLLASIGVYGFFAVYGSIMGVALLILYFIMPETKDKTLLEIESYFKYGKFTDDSDVDLEAKAIMLKDHASDSNHKNVTKQC